MEEMNNVLLKVDDLKIEFRLSGGKILRAVDGVSFSLNKGETLAIVGESGCGKTTTALSLMRILPQNGYISGGQMLYKGKDIVKASLESLYNFRWKEMSIIFQGAMNALNPVLTIEKQIVECILLHESGTEEEANKRARELFEKVEIDPSRIKQYPHEFSGGMRQRAMIAMALSCNPKIIIGDEPTTALDVMVQAQIFDLLETLKTEMDLSMILITHDLSILGDTCDKVAVMYAGQIVEYGMVEEIYEHAGHPYTKKLLNAYPVIGGERILPDSIPGVPPNLIVEIVGCRFAPRCHMVMDVCTKVKPPMIQLSETHKILCHLGSEF